MKITLSPIRSKDVLTLSKNGDGLTINGETFDFSGIPEGATLPCEAIASDWIAGDVERDSEGTLTVPLLLPHGADAPPETLFPAPLSAIENGPITLPTYEIVPEDEEAEA